MVALKPCCVEMCGSSVFSSVFAITERSKMGMYDVPMVFLWFWNLIDIMFASFYV